MNGPFLYEPYRAVMTGRYRDVSDNIGMTERANEGRGVFRPLGGEPGSDTDDGNGKDGIVSFPVVHAEGKLGRRKGSVWENVYLDMRYPQSVFSSSPSSSPACPVIWGRRYSWLASSSILPCLLCCPLSATPQAYLSYTHLSILCLAALFFFSSSSILLTMCSCFILLTWTYHFSRFIVIFLDAFTTLVVPLMCSFRILSLLVTGELSLGKCVLGCKIPAIHIYY